MKRKLIVTGLLMIFFVAVFGLSGCGLLSQASNADLTNAVGSENGPGSGNWKPQVPKNNRQARQIYAVLETLASNANEEAKAYDANYRDCFDQNVKLLDGKDEEKCIETLTALLAELRILYTDFEAGWLAYDEFRQDNDEMPSVDNLLEPPSAPVIQDLEVPGAKCCRCLTCTFGIEPEFVFRPAEIVLNE